MPKTIEQFFIDWEATAFGFGYGTGEEHVIPALKRFMELCPDGKYDFRVLETELTPTVAWLLINALARHPVEAIEYGTSPRFGWLTREGAALKGFVAARSAEDLCELACSCEDNYNSCAPTYCNCEPDGSRQGRGCINPFWKSRRR